MNLEHGTYFWIEFDPESDIGRQAARKTANMFPDRDPLPLSYGGAAICYARDLKRWYIYSMTVHTSLPRPMCNWADDGVRIVSVEIVNLLAPAGAARLGFYRFGDWDAVVHEFVDAAGGATRQNVILSGPSDSFGAHYSDVMSRRVMPTLWLERRPWWWRLRHPRG